MLQKCETKNLKIPTKDIPKRAICIWQNRISGDSPVPNFFSIAFNVCLYFFSSGLPGSKNKNNNRLGEF